MLEPLGQETGWLSIGTMYAGNGFGILAVPDINTEVLVAFEMGNIDCGRLVCFNFNDTDKPPQINTGDVVIVHKSGSFLKFHSDGSVELSPNTTLKIAGGGAALARVGDSVQVSVPSIGTCTGTITSGSAKVEVG